MSPNETRTIGKQTLLKPGQVPVEYFDWLTDHADGMFAIMRRHGNHKCDLVDSIELLLNELQLNIMKNSHHLTQRENSACSASFVIICALVHVGLGNPMWDTPALTDQFKVELRRLLKNSTAMQVTECKGDDDDDAGKRATPKDEQ